MTADRTPPLLPCPFCGSTKVQALARTCDRGTPYNPADRSYPVVRCVCGAEVAGKDWGEPDTAITAWNRRAALAAATAQPTCDGCGKPVRPLLCGHCAPASEPQAEPQPEAIPIAPVEVVRQALKELLESISECRMDQVTARFAKASVMARAVVDRYKDAT